MGRGSSGTGGGGGNSSRSVEKALSLAERGIMKNATESAICVDDNGNVLFNTSDNHASEVTFTRDQMKLASGQILTHNHPRGYCFSTEDISTASTLNLKQVRATTPDGRVYVLERKVENASGGMLTRDYAAYRRKTMSNAAEPHSQDYWDGKITNAEFQHRANLTHTRIMNKWLTDNAPKYGYVFREEKIK